MYEIIIGDCLESLKKMPDNSVNCCITSPPYFGLRDYGLPTTDWPAVSFSPMPGLPKVKVPKWTGCLGLEPDPLMFIGHIVLVFREVRRVLKKDGTLWLNFGDSYWGGKGQSGQAWSTNNQDRNTLQKAHHQISGSKETRPTDRRHPHIKPKDLIGIPWRVAFALQADGWWLRQDIIWEKPNPMPESVKDRCTKAHEYIFMFSKSSKYYYDQESIKEASISTTISRFTDNSNDKQRGHGRRHAGFNGRYAEKLKVEGVPEYRNKRSVWSVATTPYKGAHFATFPPELIRPCVKAGCPKDGTVLDPFAGSGTTGRVCIEEGRNAILLELNPSYGKLIKKRIHGAQLPMF